jgi:hypothetical protein
MVEKEREITRQKVTEREIYRDITKLRFCLKVEPGGGGFGGSVRVAGWGGAREFMGGRHS